MDDTERISIRFAVPERGWTLTGGSEDEYGTMLRLVAADGRRWSVFVAITCMADGSLDAEVTSVTS